MTEQDKSGQVRMGQDRSGQVVTGLDRSEQIWTGLHKLGEDRSGQVNTAVVRKSQNSLVMSDQVSHHHYNKKTTFKQLGFDLILFTIVMKTLNPMCHGGAQSARIEFFLQLLFLYSKQTGGYPRRPHIKIIAVDSG